MKPIAQRMHSLQENFFASLEKQIKALQDSGSDIIRLDVGSPDLPPPQPVLDALTRAAVLSTSHGYQPHSPQDMRRAWAELYQRQYGVELDPEKEILPLLGSKEGIFHLTQAMVNPGEAVLIPNPGYLTYNQAALFAGGEPYMLPLLPERGFLPNLEEVPARAAARAKMIWLNYPNNPTASVADLNFFSTAVDFARRHDLLLCHDAAYTQVTFNGCRAPSILEVPGAKEVAVEFNTLSKSHNMPGWRVGVMVGNQKVVRALSLLKANVDSSHFFPVLRAALDAMTGDQTWIIERNEIYRQRRDAALAVLAQYGCRLEPPLASLYLWCPVPCGWSSNDFVGAVLEDAHVSLTPGLVFGSQGEGYYRVSLTLPVGTIETAFHRIGKVMQAMDRRQL
jgi:LL-diaminopimelate aminotransferase